MPLRKFCSVVPRGTEDGDGGDSAMADHLEEEENLHAGIAVSFYREYLWK